MYGVSQVWISTLRYWCVLHTFPYSKGIFCLWTLNMRSIFQILWQNAFNISAGLINLSHLFCSLLFIVKYWSGTSRDCEDSSQIKVIYGATRTLIQMVWFGAELLLPQGFPPAARKSRNGSFNQQTTNLSELSALSFQFCFSSSLFHRSALV